jgi:hypothetical protein
MMHGQKTSKQNLYDLSSLRNVIQVRKSSILTIEGHLARVNEKTNEYRNYALNPEGRSLLGRTRT